LSFDGSYLSFLLPPDFSLFGFFIIVLVVCIGEFVQVDVSDLLYDVSF